MDKINSKDVHALLDKNCFNRTDKRKRKNETTHFKQRNSKLPCKDFPVFDLVKQSKENTFNLLNIKRKEKRKEDIVRGNDLETNVPFFDVVAKHYFTFC